MSRLRRAVIDTNVVVPAFMFRAGTLAWLREAVVSGALIPLVSDETLAELVRVLAYPRFGLTQEDRENIIVHYMEHAEAIKQPRTRVRLPQCRDPQDEMFIRLAYAATADAIVTGDDDLLALALESRIPILTPAAFRALA
ncbi:MAG: putative toxin-antitoxin system toxin component, PIN family [Betaproteobacteria bacterium]|nr:MAG: putative toxin-antitoxin system toxin component, PIN family [Betaproteobacteria bacterium]